MEIEATNMEAILDRIADILDSSVVVEHDIQSVWLSGDTMVT